MTLNSNGYLVLPEPPPTLEEMDEAIVKVINEKCSIESLCEMLAFLRSHREYLIKQIGIDGMQYRSYIKDPIVDMCGQLFLTELLLGLASEEYSYA